MDGVGYMIELLNRMEIPHTRITRIATQFRSVHKDKWNNTSDIPSSKDQGFALRLMSFHS
jgi:hypothetical protein